MDTQLYHHHHPLLRDFTLCQLCHNYYFSTYFAFALWCSCHTKTSEIMTSVWKARCLFAVIIHLHLLQSLLSCSSRHNCNVRCTSNWKLNYLSEAISCHLRGSDTGILSGDRRYFGCNGLGPYILLHVNVWSPNRAFIAHCLIEVKLAVFNFTQELFFLNVAQLTQSNFPLVHLCLLMHLLFSHYSLSESPWLPEISREWNYPVF